MTDAAPRHVRSPGELPQSIGTARDLWPGIAGAIAAMPQDAVADPGMPGAVPAPRAAVAARGPAAWPQAFALAATVACLALGIWIGRASAPAPVAAGAAAFAPDAQFASERQALLVQAGLGLSRLAPDERRKVEASLASLRQAIAEIRGALGEDPGNLLLQEMLVSSYQDEIRVLTAVKEAGVAGEET